jgi:hypothetical protein
MDLGSLGVLLTVVGGTGLWSVLRLVVKGRNERKWEFVKGHNERALERERREWWSAACRGGMPQGTVILDIDPHGGVRAVHHLPLPQSPSPMLRYGIALEEGGDGPVR